MAKTRKAKTTPKRRAMTARDVRRPRRVDDEPAPLPVEAFVGRGRRAQAAVDAAVDVRARQLPTGDRDDPPVDVREDDPRFDGKTETALATPQELGPIYLPSPTDAHRVLGELAALYHERFDTQRRHDALKLQLRQVAGELEKLTTRIAERIRVSTHRTGLPLFADEEADA